MTDKLRQFLKQTGMTQRDLAAALDMSEEYISRILNEKAPITPSFKGNFADVYGYETAQRVFTDAKASAEVSA
jgi:transcriptional regulator with XRE-family HTH domain